MLFLKKRIVQYRLALFIIVNFALQAAGVFVYRRSITSSEMIFNHLTVFNIINAIAVAPIVEEFLYRSWLPCEKKSTSFWQRMWFWAMCIDLVNRIIPVIFSLPLLFLFEGFLLSPLYFVGSFLDNNFITGLATSIGVLFGVSLNILFSLPLAYLVAKFTGIPSLNKWFLYSFSLLVFVLGHIETILYRSPSFLYTVLLLFFYTLGGVIFTLVYQRYGIKKAIILHGLVNVISVVSGLLVNFLF